MINYIEGKVVLKQAGILVLENNGIGYEIAISNNTLVNLPNCGEIIKIYTYLQVKEDGIALLGFYSKEEKNVFSKLITVSGVGPKTALQILSSFELNELISYIVNEDATSLCKAKGIGKKAGERIIVELKDKFDFKELITNGLNSNNQEFNNQREDIIEAIDLLVGLGVPFNEAQKIVRNLAKEVSGVEELVSRAFRMLNGWGK